MSLFRHIFGSIASGPPSIDGAEVRRLVRAGATLVDVRTAREFATGHPADAINIPLDELSARRGELPSDRPIVVYCRSGGRSASAATLLAREGFEVLDAGGLSNVMG